MSSIRILYIFILSMLWMTSCKDKPEIPFNPSAVKCNLAPEQSETIGNFTNDYLLLKDALVGTDHQQTNKSAIAMQNHIKAFKIIYDTLSAKHSTQVNMFLELTSIDKDLDSIIINNDKSCEPQRIYFKNLSDSLYAFVKNQEVSNLHLYRFYCPMALNGKGGWWFSTSRKVKNPYFGSKMLSCGELVDTLQ